MPVDSPHTHAASTHDLLAGLSRVHPFVLLADREGRVRWMNDRLLERLHGEARDALVLDAEQLSRLRDTADGDGATDCVHLDVRGANGSKLSLEACVVALADSETDDECCAIVARSSRDAEPDAAVASGALARLLDRSPQGVIVADRTGYITYANERAASFLGRSRAELTGRPAALFLSRSPDLPSLLEKLREPSGWDAEVFGLRREEGAIWLSASTQVLEKDDGGLAGVVTYLQDVTQRRVVEQELKLKNRELESYVDSVAHDLRSPLVSLLGFTRLLKEDFGEVLEEQGLHFLERVEQSGRTMDALIHDLLELSRIREPEDLCPLIDPRPVLLQLDAELKLRLEERGVAFELPTAPPMLPVDRTRLYQMFSNLIGNALTHGFPDDRSVPRDARVRVEIRQDAGAYVVSVSDNGCGIPADDHERIFEVFQTGRGVRRGEKSHGIGLAIVKKIATSYGGRVWVESAPDQGARFFVQLPNR